MKNLKEGENKTKTKRQAIHVPFVPLVIPCSFGQLIVRIFILAVVNARALFHFDVLTLKCSIHTVARPGSSLSDFREKDTFRQQCEILSFLRLKSFHNCGFKLNLGLLVAPLPLSPAPDPPEKKK